jgi:hypothetical protein
MRLSSQDANLLARPKWVDWPYNRRSNRVRPTMHEYIEIQFRRNGRPFRIARQVEGGFEFQEPDAPTRTIAIGFAAYDDGTRYRMQRIRQIKGWNSPTFELKQSVEDGSLVLRGSDEYSLPEGFYVVTANVDAAKVKKVDKRRVEVKHDGHGVVQVDLETDDRSIDVDLTGADEAILGLLNASTLPLPNGTTDKKQNGLEWVGNAEVRATRRACVLNVLASLRVSPTRSAPLIEDVKCLFIAKDDRCYAQVGPSFYKRMLDLSENHDKVYPEGHPHAKIHRLLLAALVDFDGKATGLFDEKGLWSFRAEGGPSLQLVLATPGNPYTCGFADLDLDLGNPLQDLVGFAVHIGELLDGKPTSHLDLWGKLRKESAGRAPFLYYNVVKPTK